MPITGLDDEWTLVVDGPRNKEMIYQNKRCSALFKRVDGKCWYLDAVAWRTPKSGGWSGPLKLTNGQTLLSRAYVKSFPFIPKTFIVDVIETEIAPDDWEFTLDDESKCNEFLEYYNPFYKQEPTGE